MMQRVTSLVFLGAAMVASAFALSPTMVRAGADTISLEVTTVQAGQGGQNDKKLGKLLGELKRSFKSYKAFNLSQRMTLKVGKAQSVVKRLKDGKSLVFSNMGIVGGLLRVQLDIDGTSVTMRVKNGGLWFHAKRLKGQRAWILAVRARTSR